MGIDIIPYNPVQPSAPRFIWTREGSIFTDTIWRCYGGTTGRLYASIYRRYNGWHIDANDERFTDYAAYIDADHAKRAVVSALCNSDHQTRPVE